MTRFAAICVILRLTGFASEYTGGLAVSPASGPSTNRSQEASARKAAYAVAPILS
jgi:hypothetical protein